MDCLSHAQLADLVAGRVSESFDLDFKAALYERTDQGKRSLAGDVAALANTAGGIIVLGIEEDGQAQAAAAPGIVISDGEIRRMRQVIASLVAPMPAVEILPVPASPGSERGFLIITASPSLSRPHAVLVNEGMRFPVRNGATTRYLSEAEVASAYRDRFARARSQDERVLRIEKQLKERLVSGIDEHYWLLVSLVPDIAGDLVIDPDTLITARAQILGTFPMIIRPSNFSWHQVEVGRRRLLLSGSPSAATWLAADLHHDGAGVFGVNVADTSRMASEPKPNRIWLHDEQIVNGILTGLEFLARHARDRAAASGDALIRASLYRLSPRQRIFLGTGTRQDHARNGRQLQYRGGRHAESAAPLDALADGPGLVAAAYLLATDLLQDFGLPEVPQLTRNGELRSHYWNDGMHAGLRQWATHNNVTVTDSLLPGEDRSEAASGTRY